MHSPSHLVIITVLKEETRKTQKGQANAVPKPHQYVHPWPQTPHAKATISLKENDKGIVPRPKGVYQLLRRTSVENVDLENLLSVHLGWLPTIQVRHYPHADQYNPQHRSEGCGFI
jgi:hypothetical protein